MFALCGRVHQIIVIGNQILVHDNRIILMVVDFVTLLTSCVLLHLRVIERLFLGYQSTISCQILTFTHMVIEHLMFIFHDLDQRIVLVIFPAKVVILILLVLDLFQGLIKGFLVYLTGKVIACRLLPLCRFLARVKLVSVYSEAI